MFGYLKFRRELKSKIRQIEEESGSRKWYYFMDFGYGVKVGKEHRRDKTRGYSNWKNLLADHLPRLTGLRVLDIGCNAGVNDLEMCKQGASEVIGIDLDTSRAEFVKAWYERKDARRYENVRFISADVGTYDLLHLGSFDLICLFSIVYHLGDHIERIFSQLQQMTPAIALQGNLVRLSSVKYSKRKYQELAGVEGMVALLKRYGFENIHIQAPEGYPRPLVIGSK